MVRLEHKSGYLRPLWPPHDLILLLCLHVQDCAGLCVGQQLPPVSWHPRWLCSDPASRLTRQEDRHLCPCSATPQSQVLPARASPMVLLPGGFPLSDSLSSSLPDSTPFLP